MPDKPSIINIGLGLLNRAEKGELDDLLGSALTLVLSLSVYRPAQGCETALDREAFALQHVELRSRLMEVLRQFLALNLPLPTGAAELPTADALEGLESWMADVDAAVAVVTHTTTVPGDPAEYASSAPGASPDAPGAAGALPGHAASGEPALSLFMGEDGGEP